MILGGSHKQAQIKPLGKIGLVFGAARFVCISTCVVMFALSVLSVIFSFWDAQDQDGTPAPWAAIAMLSGIAGLAAGLIGIFIFLVGQRFAKKQTSYLNQNPN